MALPDWLPPGETMTDEQFRVWLAQQKRKRAHSITDLREQRAHVTLPNDDDGPVLPPEEWSFSYHGKHMEPEEVLAVLDEERKWLHGEVPTDEE